MAKHLRYRGEFVSVHDVVWRVEIHQEHSAPYASVGELDFPADSPLRIAWKETEVYAPVCSSEATLRIISPTDRTYVDLCDTAPGDVRMDVYRDNVLFWSGTLDSEFYSEPYERLNMYDVELTFTDFGLLDREKYSLEGMVRLDQILDECLDRSQILFSGVDYYSLSSTTFTDDTKADLGHLSVRSDNFEDEEGVRSTLREVLDGILQPLALRMIQKGGLIYVYDINGLITQGTEVRELEWDGDSQTLTVAAAANNVTVTFSPYGRALCSPELTYEAQTSRSALNQTTDPIGASPYGEFYTYFPDYGSAVEGMGTPAHPFTDAGMADFTIFLTTDEYSGLSYISPRARCFQILRQGGGASDTVGVAATLRVGRGNIAASTGKLIQGNAYFTDTDTPQPLMRTERIYLPPLPTDVQSLGEGRPGANMHNSGYYVRITVPMMLDCRYNPFSEASEDNESGNYERWKGIARCVLVPFAAKLYNDSGTVTAHYDNREIAEASVPRTLSRTQGQWVTGDSPAQGYTAFLEYYDKEKDEPAVFGWRNNRQTFGRYYQCYANTRDYGWRKLVTYKSFLTMPDGQYIPYPSQGGWLEVTVYAAYRVYGKDRGGTPPTIYQGGQTAWEADNYESYRRWWLFQAPKVEVVTSDVLLEAADLEDVEFSAQLNPYAKDGVSIDTVCGSMEAPAPHARGALYRTSDMTQIRDLKRADVTDRPEQLLIGTVYSQMAQRHTTLSGITLDEGQPLVLYTERNQGDRLFMATAEDLDCIRGENDMTITEVSPDDYKAR